MKKILYCITKGNFGGAQKYVYELATSIDKNEYETVVVCGEGDILPKKLEAASIRVIRLASMKRDIGIINELKSFVELYKIFKKEKPDVIHLNSSKMGGSGSFIGRLAGVKNIIFTAHGFAFNENRSFISKKILLAFHYLTILLAHKTIMVSEKTKKDIDYLPFIQNRLVKIYNGIDTNLEFYPKKTALEIVLQGKHIDLKNKTVLLSIGELHSNKGYDLFIKSLRHVDRDFIYLIIGEGEERNNIVRTMKENDIRDRVYLLGKIEDAYKYIQAADIFVLPSRTEAFPYVLLESGLAGSAVLASNVGGIPEVIEEGKTGMLFNVNDVVDTVEKVTRLIDEKGLRDNVSANIREKVVGEFSQDEMVKKTMAIYSK